MLQVQQRGSLAGPHVIFLHGFLGSKEDWDPLIDSLDPGLCCWTIDIPGHGQSPYSPKILETLSEWIHTKKTPLLVGYSMGGRIALELYRRSPRSFCGAIILSAYVGKMDAKEKAQREYEEERWKEKILSSDPHAFLDAWYAQPLFATLQQQNHLYKSMLERRLTFQPNALFAAYDELRLTRLPPLDILPCPGYFLYGSADEKYAKLYSALPDTVSVDSVPSCGHAIHLEAPTRCSQLMKQWMHKERLWP